MSDLAALPRLVMRPAAGMPAAMNGRIGRPSLRPALALLAALVALGNGAIAADVAPASPTPADTSAPSGSADTNSANPDYGTSNQRGRRSSNYPRMLDPDFMPVRPMAVYFPPVAPRLDAALDQPNVLEAHRPAPAELAAFVNEPFYAPLSTRLAEDSLRPKQRQRLEAYLAAKLKLQNELRAHLSVLAGADPVTRQREFAALAVTEDPQIDELEKSAEQLRLDLIRGEFLQSNVDWNESRDWRLGESRFRSAADAIAAQFQVMRGAAFYQKGLLPTQRRLLREVAMELGDIPLTRIEGTADQPGEDTAPTDTNPLLYFSPETARVYLPADLPADLADRIAAYEKEKSQLKKELRDTVYDRDTASFSFLRTRAVTLLAQQQEARLAALEAKAEEIRRGLIAYGHPPRPPAPPPISPALEARIAGFLQSRIAMHQKLVLLLRNARQQVEIDRIAYVQVPNGRFTLNISVSPFNRDEAKLKKVQEDFAAFSQDSAARTADLAKELAAIRSDIAGTIDAGPGEEGEKRVTRFLSDCITTIEERADWQRYADYRTAVLEPGLSPAQRRLLYDAALVDLNLPLPGLEHGPLQSAMGRRGYSLSSLSPSAPSNVMPR